MKNNYIYHKIYDLKNLILAWKKARKGKTKKAYVIDFEENLGENLRQLKFELMSRTYKPKPLVSFIVQDPKTRKISKSDFRDRIVHHALIRVIEPIFDRCFIYDSCANRTGRGNLFALKRFDLFKRKVTQNLKKEAFCFKADIKHYFQEIDHNILMEVVKRKITDKRVIWLIEAIIANRVIERKKPSKEKLDYYFTESVKGMPLGNLTSQFFANVYLNELDYFVKQRLKAKYYIRYVDDFVVLNSSREQLESWKLEIDKFLRENLKIELHPDKSKIISLSKGIDFVGFRNFYYFKLLRKRNVKKMLLNIEKYRLGHISYEKIIESFQGWNAYAKWANSFKLRKEVVGKINKIKFYHIQLILRKWVAHDMHGS